MKSIFLIIILFISLNNIYSQQFIQLDSAVETSKGKFFIAKIQMAWTTFTQNTVNVKLEWGLYQDTNYNPIDFKYTDTTLTPGQIQQFSQEVIPLHLPLLYRSNSGSGQGYSSKYLQSDTLSYSDTNTTLFRLKLRLKELQDLHNYLISELAKNEGAIIRLSDFIKEEELLFPEHK
ncbi:MAG TPA: hypothetical protein DIS94_03310 [Bacteroidetes bacterium]|nr:hypothetical protein [Bacteroidota bacterium]HRE42291.1 hypothetical protein [Ignavibacteria bacterium]